MSPFRILVAVVAGIWLSGCRAAPVAGPGATTLRVSAGDTAAQDQLWTAAQDCVRDFRFRIDRVDPVEGVITSWPETSKHYFEFWRRDAVTGYDVWESTINPIRRWVEIRVDRAADAMDPQVAVTVHKQRLSSPDRQFNNSTAAYRFFGDALPSTTGIVRVTPEYDRWLSLGRDPALEARLVDQIILRSRLEVLERGESHIEVQPPPPSKVDTPSSDAASVTPPANTQTAPPATPIDAAPTAPAPQPQSPPPSAIDSAAIVPLIDVESSIQPDESTKSDLSPQNP